MKSRSYRRRRDTSSDDPIDHGTRNYLTQSLEDIPIFRARYSSQITDEQRLELVLNELSLVRKEVDTKSIETQCKANWFRVINTLSSLIILASSAVIIGLQAASTCLNIPVIVFSSIIFVMEGTHKIFRWGPQGVLYKNGTVRLKRISRQIRDYMYMFHRYNVDQLLTIISQLRAQFDDIDVNLYKTSMAGAAKYNTGFEVDNPEIDNVNMGNINAGSPTSTPVLLGGNGGNNNNNNGGNNGNNSSPHVHIHIDQSPMPSPLPSHLQPPSSHISRRGTVSAPTLDKKLSESVSESTPVLVIPIDNIISTPETPRKILRSSFNRNNTPNISVSEPNTQTPPSSLPVPIISDSP